MSDNYLSGIFGGITFGQWRQILRVPGVAAAAPIANIGYVVPLAQQDLVLNRYLNQDPVQLYRVHLTWVADRGTSRYPGATLYVYYTRSHRFKVIAPAFGTAYELAEITPGSKPEQVCPFSFVQSLPRAPRTPFSASAAGSSYLECYSARSPAAGARNLVPLPRGEVGTATDTEFPMLVAAIDPVQEQRLVGLRDAIDQGRYLEETDRAVTTQTTVTLPVIASDTTYVDASLDVSIERLSIARGTDVPAQLASPTRAYPFVKNLGGHIVGRERISAQSLYGHMLDRFSGSKPEFSLGDYWTVAPTTYRADGGDRIGAVPASNSDAVWKDPCQDRFFPAPAGNQDLQFRALTIHPQLLSGQGCNTGAAVHVIGRFDPGALPGFDQLSQVPLESYYPPESTPADAASRQALGGRPLLPDMNLGGYVAQPPIMFTTLDAARRFLPYFEDNDHRAPISVIRVRVAGATGPDAVSRERIRLVAQAIRDQTGLAVDITAGSSPQGLTVDLPAGEFGRPPLTLTEGWVKKGVSIAILDAVDRKSLALFALVLVSCGLFLTNGALAAARTRRAEIGTLRSFGWSRPEVFRLLLTEMAIVGLIAGLLGAALGAAMIAAFSFNLPFRFLALVPPTALLTAVAAGLVPAWRASRASPLDAFLPAASERGSRARVRSTVSLAFANLLRVPGRTVLGALGLFAGVTALTMILAVNVAFQGTVVGTLLGGVVSVRVRGVDTLSVAIVIGLGGLAVADVLFLNVRERASEFGSLRATGWDDREISAVVALEGLGIGVLGSGAGGLLGVLLAAAVAGFRWGIVEGGIAAVLAGTLVVVVLSLIPALMVRRMTPASVLAEE